jgi:hypothetical protein
MSNDTLIIKQRKDKVRELFSSKIEPTKDRWSTVTVDSALLEKAKEFATVKLDYKVESGDRGYTKINGKGDSYNAGCRSITGSIAEFAIQKSLAEHGIYVDVDTNLGKSKDFNIPDFPTINTGVKAAMWGNIPVIFKGEQKYPQIMCIVEKIDDTKYDVHICGVAYPRILNDPRNRTDDGIADPAMLYKKTSFVGFKYLTDWETYISRIQSNMAN